MCKVQKDLNKKDMGFKLNIFLILLILLLLIFLFIFIFIFLFFLELGNVLKVMIKSACVFSGFNFLFSVGRQTNVCITGEREDRLRNEHVPCDPDCLLVSFVLPLLLSPDGVYGKDHTRDKLFQVDFS